MFILWGKTHVVTEFDLVHFVDMKGTCLSCIGFLQWLVTTPSFEELHNLNIRTLADGILHGVVFLDAWRVT